MNISFIDGHKAHSRTGFTIVELLIVIVVIGILAAITIVAFTGIQQRARNTQTISAANAYLKAFAQYKTLNSVYPPSGGLNYNCLGENNPGDQCWRREGTAGTTDGMFENATVHTALRTVMGSLPDASTSLSNGRNGIMYVNHPSSAVTLDGVVHGTYLMYVLDGAGAKCTAGTPLSGNWATFTSAVPSTGYTVNLSSVGVECWVALR